MGCFFHETNGSTTINHRRRKLAKNFSCNFRYYLSENYRRVWIFFDSRIVYISESGPKKCQKKRLAIVDQDGENHKFLTDGSYLALTPRFSPAAQEIAYLSYNNQIPRIYLLDLETGNQKILGDFPGMTFSPRYSPDGKKIVMSFAKNWNTDIYEMGICKH